MRADWMQTKLDILDIPLMTVDKFSIGSHYIVLLVFNVCVSEHMFFFSSA